MKSIRRRTFLANSIAAAVGTLGLSSCSNKQNLARTDSSIKPLSSGKTMLYPCRRAFFYTRPVLLSPTLNGLLVAFAGSPFGLLTPLEKQYSIILGISLFLSIPHSHPLLDTFLAFAGF